MEKRIGRVLAAFEDGSAEILAERQSACGGCQDTRNCKTCLSGSNKIVAVARNTARALPGDLVEVEQASGALLGGAALVYGLPVVGFLVGAFLGNAMANAGGAEGPLSAVLAGLVGLGLLCWL